MKEKLTIQRIAKLQCDTGKGQGFLFDTESPRLAVRVTAAGAKSFIFEGKLDRQTIRRTIGAVSAWNLDDARKEANRLQRMLDQGIDPREHEAAQKATKAAEKAEEEKVLEKIAHNQKYTLKALCETYARHLDAMGKTRSAAAARSVFKCHLGNDVADTPAAGITSEQIADIVRAVHAKGKERSAGVLRSYLCAAYNYAWKAPFKIHGTATNFAEFGITDNPVLPVENIKVSARERFLSHEELKKYLSYLGDDLVDQILLLGLYSGGQRTAQLLRAEVGDWNPDTRTLTLLDGKGKREKPRVHHLPLGPIAAGIVERLVLRAKALKENSLFSSRGAVTHLATPGKRVKEISLKISDQQFDLRDVRRTAETILASMGVSRDLRAQLLSHGITGVQAAHYDKHGYIEEKRECLERWELALDRIKAGLPIKDDKNKIVDIRQAGGAK